MRIATGILAILTTAFSAITDAEPIERLNPAAGIASIRIDANEAETQIHVTFTEDMIPLGGGHGSIPIRLEGRGSCDWG